MDPNTHRLCQAASSSSDFAPELPLLNVGVQTGVNCPPAAADAEEGALPGAAMTTSSPSCCGWMGGYVTVVFSSSAAAQSLIYSG